MNNVNYVEIAATYDSIAARFKTLFADTVALNALVTNGDLAHAERAAVRAFRSLADLEVYNEAYEPMPVAELEALHKSIVDGSFVE